MIIDIQETEHCKVLVKYETDAEIVRTKKEQIVNKFKGRKVPGFRDNHIPMSAIKEHFRKEINEALKQELAEAEGNHLTTYHTQRLPE